MVARLFLLFICCMILFVFSLFVIPRAFGDPTISGEIQSMAALTRIPDEAWSLTGTAFGRLSASAESAGSVKAELSLDAYTLAAPYIDIYRAYMKVRFPLLRATMGKTRLSWGEGFYFNAGDILFGSLDIDSDLTSELFRTTGGWLAAVTVPLGRFSFLQGAVLPPLPNLSATGSEGTDLPRVTDTTAGLRGVTKAGPVKLEGGYGYQGSEDIHEPYVGIQGNLVADYHVTAACSVPTEEPEWEDVEDSLRLSWGLYYLVPGLRDVTLSFRLEGLVRPRASWEAIEPSTAEDYGILLYPEIVISPVQSLSILLRSVVSPVDWSALTLAGMDWNVFQGFHLLFFTALQAGEENDLFSWDRPGSLIFTSGFRFVF